MLQMLRPPTPPGKDQVRPSGHGLGPGGGPPIPYSPPSPPPTRLPPVSTLVDTADKFTKPMPFSSPAPHLHQGPVAAPQGHQLPHTSHGPHGPPGSQFHHVPGTQSPQIPQGPQGPHSPIHTHATNVSHHANPSPYYAPPQHNYAQSPRATTTVHTPAHSPANRNYVPLASQSPPMYRPGPSSTAPTAATVPPPSQPVFQYHYRGPVAPVPAPPPPPPPPAPSVHSGILGPPAPVPSSYPYFDNNRHVKPKRKRATSYQVNKLNQVFEQTFFPSSELRLSLAMELGMTPRTVQIWFQNKRQVWRSEHNRSIPRKGSRQEQDDQDHFKE
uniref:ARAD1D19624p n=1 Tax=Blastobotrys adeninivorans TaxID=409370 RepID=A0A060TA12_BLAAD